uniref:BAI1 associated protein 3 n=1 Tax=Cyprinus carpio TaxID=7962 RepID=A0A8C1XVG7_CYPCA
MKGKNLMAKDANGYSDPYCMLGILLGQSPKDTEEKKERKFSFRKRREKLEKRSSVKEVLAGRDIQVTEVKPESLNPVWNEHFVFDIDDVHNDLLHLDIWDHDDDVSVAEACKKLNEISGFRGMGRYFKQIAKSVRSNGAAASGSEENADDFLGCINIPLNEIPVVGYDKWFKLEPRSSASKVQGECHLILRLFTTQVLLPILIIAACFIYTCLPTVRLTLVCKTDVFACVCSRWQCYSSHHRSQRMSYALLLRLLKTVEAEWEDTAVHGELVSFYNSSLTLNVWAHSCAVCNVSVLMIQLEPIQRQTKHSSSAVDVTTCFTQVQEFWAQLAWPDSAGAFIFITRLTDVSASKGQLGRDHKSFIMQVCVALNSTEHVRVYLGGLPRELDWRGVEQAMEESCGLEGKEQVNKSLNGQLYNADIDLQREAKRLIAHLTDKVVACIKKCIQHISLSPDSINNDEAVAPLMKYLDDTLVILNESLVKENLTRVLQSLWELLLRMIMDTVVENRGVQVEFYTRFQYTVETLVRFFHADGEGMLLEDLKSGDYKALDEELRLNKCSSFELIEQYFLEKISQQRILKHSRFGRISVKCYYDAPEQRLTVEILHAADLIALDANGLSDPFVIVELCPHHLFPTARSQLPHQLPEQYRHRCACLTFTVMDYDWLSTNDFAGEAVAPLSDFCWPGRPSATPAGKTLQPVILHLSRQKPSGMLICPFYLRPVTFLL